MEFLGHTNAIKYIILEIISWKQYVSGIFFEFARYGHTLTSVSSEHAQIVKIVLAVNGCTPSYLQYIKNVSTFVKSTIK